ncbi:MAG: FAD-dependent oxidoreductase [Clostridiales bacterium]|nr:FAD-dependent oxidoreductase [Clostridiales bacterium]
MYRDREYEYDVIIVGLGAGGVGAAVELAGSGLKTAVIERSARAGGTMVVSGVSVFESSVSVGAVARLIAGRLMEKGQGRVQRSLPTREGDRFGMSVDCAGSYDSTLRDEGALGPTEVRRFAFDDEAMEREIRALLDSENVTLLLGHTLTDAEVKDRVIRGITVFDGKTAKKLRARLYLDCTGNAALAKLCGCQTTMGQESKSKYNEPSAPLKSTGKINGVTLIFKVSKGGEELLPPPAIADVDISAWENQALFRNDVWFCTFALPNGDMSINMCPTMPGKEYYSMTPTQAYEVCAARVFAFWRYIKGDERFKGYKLKQLFPALGIREEERIVGSFVLTQKDVFTRFEDSPLRDAFVAYSDHMIDTHGCDEPPVKLTHPFGIPYACMLPQEIDNMLVASKGASFSYLAASSCRLSRTVMDMGEAAARACKQAISQGIDLRQVKIGVPFLEGYESIGVNKIS